MAVIWEGSRLLWGSPCVPSAPKLVWDKSCSCSWFAYYVFSYCHCLGISSQRCVLLKRQPVESSRSSTKHRSTVSPVLFAARLTIRSARVTFATRSTRSKRMLLKAFDEESCNKTETQVKLFDRFVDYLDQKKPDHLKNRKLPQRKCKTQSWKPDLSQKNNGSSQNEISSQEDSLMRTNHVTMGAKKQKLDHHRFFDFSDLIWIYSFRCWGLFRCDWYSMNELPKTRGSELKKTTTKHGPSSPSFDIKFIIYKQESQIEKAINEMPSKIFTEKVVFPKRCLHSTTWISFFMLTKMTPLWQAPGATGVPVQTQEGSRKPPGFFGKPLTTTIDSLW